MMSDLTPEATGDRPEIPPTETARPEIGKPKRVAGGIPAIVQSMKHAVGEAGFIRGNRELLAVNQKDGFDCPGCAWPDPDGHREMTEFCENGAKAVAEETTTRRVDPAFFARHSVAELAKLGDYEIGKSGRVTHPMLLRENGTHYEPVSWDEAFSIIADELRGLASPDEAIFYTSGRTSNEAAFAYQLFVRLFGTNNLPDCSNMCHESSGSALRTQIGVGKGTVTLDDFNHADVVVVIGQNPGTNHPRMLTALQKSAERGCKIISINPLFETGTRAFKHPQKFWTWFGEGTKLAALHLPVRPGGDIAVLKGIMKEMLEEERKAPGTVFNLGFIAEKTVGYDAFIADLDATPWDDIVRESGCTRENIRAAAEILAASKATICCWAMGLTQQAQGYGAIQTLMNLLLLGAHFGRKGAGACPVRGHSNVQGDRTMGIYEKPPKAFVDALAKEFNYDKFPYAHGVDAVEAIHALHEGRGKVFFAMGGNFLSATPDTIYTADALRRTRLTVHVSTKLNRSHLVTGKRALILPALGRTDLDIQESGEQIVSVENSMSVVSMSHGELKPGPQMRSEVAIVCGLALATFAGDAAKEKVVDWKKLQANYDHIRDHISRSIPDFQDFNVRLRKPGGFYLSNPPRDEQRFATPENRAHFLVHPLPRLPLRDNEMCLITIRSHDQFNTTIYGLHDRYRGVHNGRRVIFMNAEDIAAQKLTSGQWVDITSHWKGETRRAERFMVVPYEIPRQSAAAYFPETNVLVPIGSTVPVSNTPTYKTVVITVAPSPE